MEWAQQFSEVIWLDSNAYPHLHSTFDAILAVDALVRIKTDTHNAFRILQGFRKDINDWVFGYLSYDMKNDIESLSSRNKDELGFPDMHFFQPKKIIFVKGNKVTFCYPSMFYGEVAGDFHQIISFKSSSSEKSDPQSQLKITARLQKNEYIARIQEILAQIQHGNIHEANFCQEFYAREAIIDPLATYKKLNTISLAPFSVYLKLEDHYLLSASPERYLKKEKS
ncbi:MAG: chorismate-binding protein, partial [Bacteroidota bacterium]